MLKLTQLLLLSFVLVFPTHFFGKEGVKLTNVPSLKRMPMLYSLPQRKGSFYVNWGYNRSYYRNTDIEFKGKGFDFTMEDVSAHDLPEEFSAKIYLNPLKFTIPQFDFRIGYFINEKYSVSLGWDHMKYRITETQSVRLSGTIDESVSEQYAGQYDDQAFLLTPAD